MYKHSFTAKKFNFLGHFKEAIYFYLEDEGNSKNQFVFDELSNTLGACRFPELQERFYTFIQLKKREKTRRKNTVTPATVNKYIAYAKAVCNYAIKYSKLETSPIADFPLQKVNNARDRVLSPDEELRLFNAVKQEAPYLEPALRFCLRVPIRRGELISMTRDQLDLFRGVIYLREGTTKNGAGAILPIPPDMLDYFRDIPVKSDYLFFRYIKKRDEYVGLGDFKKAWKNILNKAKIRNFRFHDTRHQAAAFLGRNGTPESVLMKIGNWKTTSVFRRYRHIHLHEITSAVQWTPEKCDTPVTLQQKSTGTEN